MYTVHRAWATPLKPPMVAIYTAHRPGNQCKEIACSLDQERRWTIYPEIPAPDIGEAASRDPKVFWYAPGAKWVRVVALVDQKKVQF